MRQTKHMDRRMNQRGITKDMVNLTLEHGVVKRDQRILNRKTVDRVIKALEAELRAAKKVRDKGGIVVVAANDEIITAYDFDSANKRKNY